MTIKNTSESAWQKRAIIPNIRQVIVLILLCVGALGGLAFGYHRTNNILWNNMNDLDPLYAVKIKDVDLQYNEETELYEKAFSSYEMLQEELGIDLIETTWSEDNPYMKIYYVSNDKSWASITINAFIVGDVSNLQEVNLGKNINYNCSQGNHFKTPLDLKIFLLLNDEAVRKYQGKDYLGSYNKGEKYITDTGITYYLIQNESSDLSKAEEYIIVFVINGVQYELSGYVDKETITSIMNSMR